MATNKMDGDGVSVTDELIDFVRGRSSETSTARIADAAAHDPKLAAEIGVLRAMHAELERAAADEPGAQELEWARISRAINAERPAFSAQRAPIWRIAAAVLGVVAVGEAAYIGLADRGAGVARYATASDQPTTLQPAYLAQATFSPDAVERDIRELLLSLDGRFVDGPSALGVYRVSFASADLRDAGVAALKDAHGIVATAAAE